MATPVRTAGSNLVYRGPSPDIGDAWCRREPSNGVVYLEWELTESERADVAAGALLRLGIYGLEPIPPVSLGVSDADPLSDAGAALRDRALAELVRVGTEDSRDRPGCWVASADVRLALEEEGAFDPNPQGDVPTLWGRPLLQLLTAGTDVLRFEPLTGEEAEA